MRAFGVCATDAPVRTAKKMMRFTLLAFVLLASALGARAASVFNVSIDTASLASTGGYLNFQVNGPAAADPLSIVLSDFNFDGTLDPLDADLCFGDTPCPITGQIGSDPTMSFSNDAGSPPVLIDYLQPVVFGNLLSFRLVFTGMALDNPTVPSPGATAFRVLLFSAAFQPLLSDDAVNGSILSFLTDEGTVTPTNYSSAGEADLSEVPEPATAALILAGCAFLFARRRSFGRRHTG